IGNSETAYNKFASINMGFKEAILDEKEKKKEKKSWKVITLRLLANVLVLILLVSSAYAVVLVVERSQQPDGDSNWWRQNEVTVVVSMISTVYPSFFDLIGLLEHYHPRQQLRWQLARILILYLLNLYTLIFALFAKVSAMTDQLLSLKPNETSSAVTASMLNSTTMLMTPTPTTITDWSTTTEFINCTLMLLPNCTNVADILRTEFPQYTFAAVTDYVQDLGEATAALINSTLNGTAGNVTEDPLNSTIFSLFENVTDLSTDSDITTFVSGFITSIFASAFKMKTPKEEMKIMNSVMDSWQGDDEDDFVTEPPYSQITNIPNPMLGSVLEQCIVPICRDLGITEGFIESRTKRSVDASSESGIDTKCLGKDCPVDRGPQQRLANDTDEGNSTYLWNFGSNYTLVPRNCSSNDCMSTIPTESDDDVVTTEMTTIFETTPTAPAYYSYLSEEDKLKLKKLCWETMFGQELVKLTVMDLVLTLFAILLTDWFRAFFVRFVNKCCCWDLEKNFPGYGDFKIAENILHMVNNQGMIWMGMFFSPGLPAINTVKLVIMMYARSWAVLTCNIPHETVFRASRSNNFYFALLLVMLFLCTLPVGYAIVWLEPSWHCGPFSDYSKIYKLLTSHLTAALPDVLNKVLDYVTSPGIVIPMLLLLILAIYYYVSVAASLREANEDLKIQLRRERNDDKRKANSNAEDKKELTPEAKATMENALDAWTSKKGPDISKLKGKRAEDSFDDYDDDDEAKL
ncbi:TMC3 (predicted), partial [Pycnogonum litorale]